MNDLDLCLEVVSRSSTGGTQKYTNNTKNTTSAQIHTKKQQIPSLH